MAPDPRPGWPDDYGLAREPEESVEVVEPANLLATEARERLLALGFEDTQIVEWAVRYVAATGDEATEVDAFVDWIAARQQP